MCVCEHDDASYGLSRIPPFSLYVFEWIMDGKFSFGYRRTFNRTAISIRISCLFPPTIFSLSYCLTKLFLVLVLLHAKQRNPVRPQSTMVILIYFSFYTHAALNECKIICRFWQMCVQCSRTGNGNYPLIIWFFLAAATTTAVVPVIAVDTGADAAEPEEKTGGAGGGKGSGFQHRCFF